MHPILRNVVIGLVGLIIAGALIALAVVGGEPDVSILALLSAGLTAAGVGLFLYAQGWVWSSRTARQRQTGQSILVALGGGFMALVAAAALAGIVILVLLFVLG